MKTRKIDYKKMSLILPIAILFSIIIIGNGGYSGGFGGYSNLYLQPTLPSFHNVNYGSFYFNAAPYYVAPTYRYYQPSYVGFNYVPYTVSPPYYSYSRPSQFYVRSYALPAKPIYTTPTRAMFNVNYAYSNVGRVW